MSLASLALMAVAVALLGAVACHAAERADGRSR